MGKQIITRHASDVTVIAKLEKPQAIDHLEEILEVADGVMVARGDLGVEVPPEKVPVIQKHVIRRAAAWRKPVITATQMLESMIENPRPTRAEASDVANAVFDGTDAVMLSAETASGRYPREAVSIMSRIIIEA
jgi:pyruvate kinase